AVLEREVRLRKLSRMAARERAGRREDRLDVCGEARPAGIADELEGVLVLLPARDGGRAERDLGGLELRRRARDRELHEPDRGAGCAPRMTAWESVCLGDVRRLKPLRSLRHFERNALTLFERAEAGPADRRIVHEDVFTLVRGDEAVPLLSVEPLDLALSHG